MNRQSFALYVYETPLRDTNTSADGMWSERLCRLTPSPHTVLSCSLFMYILQVSALCHTVLRSAGAFEKSKIQEWPLDGVSDLVQVSSVAAHSW